MKILCALPLAALQFRKNGTDGFESPAESYLQLRIKFIPFHTCFEELVSISLAVCWINILDCVISEIFVIILIGLCSNKNSLCMR